jgi:hypothetical protein
MRARRWRFRGGAALTAVVGALVATALVPGTAQAVAPENDDFANSTVVSAVPFTTRVDTGAATKAADDPSWCQFFEIGGTVWFTYTAAENGMLRATTAGSDYDTIVSANVGDPGQLRGVTGSCATGSGTRGATATFPVTAGTTYHLMVAGRGVTGGMLNFGLSMVAPPVNDNFADAEPLSLPSNRVPDTTAAWFEEDESALNCFGTGRSVWYSFTPDHAVSAVVGLEGNFESAYAVFTGRSLLDLHQLACERSGFGSETVFRATPGTTYHIVVVQDLDLQNPVTFSLTEAPALRPTILFPSDDPSIFVDTSLSAFTDDPYRQPIAGGRWDFGDGTSAPVPATENDFTTIAHHYTADGTYRITLSLSTQDGRTGTSTRSITVTTHDVSISRFDTPARARSGSTKPITVNIANTRYAESATVTLYRNNGLGFESVGALTLDVPAQRNRSVAFPFAYTFTPQDAVSGLVTFRAVVELQFPVRDARPQDNEVIAFATTVSGPHALRFA